jgi:hypothetical protein
MSYNDIIDSAENNNPIFVCASSNREKSLRYQLPMQLPIPHVACVQFDSADSSSFYASGIVG